MNQIKKNDEDIILKDNNINQIRKSNKIKPQKIFTKKTNIFKKLSNQQSYKENINFLQNQLEGYVYCNQSAMLIRQRYIYVRNMILYLELICFILSLISFSQTYHRDNFNNSFSTLIIMLVITLFKSITILLYLYSYKIYNKFLISIGDIKFKENIFNKDLKIQLILKCILLFIHPQYYIKNIKSPLEENYFLENVYITFQRDFNHYLYMIQYIVSTSLIFYIILENTKFANVQTKRITKMFGIQNDIKFIFKCLLTQHGPLFIIFQFFAGIFLFAVLVSIGEIGFYLSIQSLNVQKFQNQEIQIQATQLVYYYNSFWYVMITVTTIGYGDMFARANISKILIFLCSFYGVVIFPLLVVTITNIFQIPNQDKISLLVVKMINQKKELKKLAAKSIVLFCKLYLKKNLTSLQKSQLQQNLQTSLKQLQIKKKKYKTLQYSDNTADVCKRIFKLQNEFEILEKLMQKKIPKKPTQLISKY